MKKLKFVQRRKLLENGAIDVLAPLVVIQDIEVMSNYVKSMQREREKKNS